MQGCGSACKPPPPDLNWLTEKRGFKGRWRGRRRGGEGGGLALAPRLGFSVTPSFRNDSTVLQQAAAFPPLRFKLPTSSTNVDLAVFVYRRLSNVTENGRRLRTDQRSGFPHDGPPPSHPRKT